MVLLNYFLLKIGFKKLFKTKPISISLELSSICNLSCPECKCGIGKVNRANPFISFEAAKSIIELHLKSAFIVQLFFQGEPLMNPFWEDIARYCHEKKLFTIINTNGHFFDDKNIERLLEAGVGRIVVSVDGMCQEVYEKYRKGGSLERVLNGTRKIASRRQELGKKIPELVFQCLVNRFNEKHLSAYKRFAAVNGADRVEFKSMQLYDQSINNIHYWLPEDQKYRRYNISKRWKSNSIVCFRALTTAVFTSDGLLVPCCFDKEAEFSFGNFYFDPWNSDQRREFIGDLLSKKTTKPHICMNCTRNL